MGLAGSFAFGARFCGFLLVARLQCSSFYIQKQFFWRLELLNLLFYISYIYYMYIYRLSFVDIR